MFVDEDAAGEDHGLGALACGNEAAFDEELIETGFHGRVFMAGFHQRIFMSGSLWPGGSCAF